MTDLDIAEVHFFPLLHRYHAFGVSTLQRSRPFFVEGKPCTSMPSVIIAESHKATKPGLGSTIQQQVIFGLANQILKKPLARVTVQASEFRFRSTWLISRIPIDSFEFLRQPYLCIQDDCKMNALSTQMALHSSVYAYPLRIRYLQVFCCCLLRVAHLLRKETGSTW